MFQIYKYIRIINKKKTQNRSSKFEKMKFIHLKKNNCNSSFDIAYDPNYSFVFTFSILSRWIIIQRNIILNRKSCFFQFMYKIIFIKIIPCKNLYAISVYLSYNYILSVYDFFMWKICYTSRSEIRDTDYMRLYHKREGSME